MSVIAIVIAGWGLFFFARYLQKQIMKSVEKSLDQNKADSQAKQKSDPHSEDLIG